MHTSERSQSLKEELFGFQFEAELMAEIDHIGEVHHYPAGTTIMEIGDACTLVPIVLSGALKVMREDPDGNELLLYYLESGDTCLMSFSSGTGRKHSKVRAVSECEADVLMIPVSHMDEWMGKYPGWRAFVFEAIRLRMDEFIQAVDSLAFMRLEERLKKYLQDRARVLGTTDLEITHQEIADDLHTSRVVVSRILKQLEHEGLLHIRRNHLVLASF